MLRCERFGSSNGTLPTLLFGREMVDIYSEADAAAMLNARIVALTTVLDLTADQEKLWEPVEASIRHNSR